MNVSKLKNEWFGNIKGDVLAGIVVALALIPEAISFSIIAGVDPMVGLYASFCIAITIAFVGGRPAMISAATGATALVMVTLVAQTWFTISTCCNHFDRYYPDHNGRVKTRGFNKIRSSIGDDRICECLSNHDFYRSITIFC